VSAVERAVEHLRARLASLDNDMPAEVNAWIVLTGQMVACSDTEVADLVRALEAVLTEYYIGPTR